MILPKKTNLRKNIDIIFNRFRILNQNKNRKVCGRIFIQFKFSTFWDQELNNSMLKIIK